MESQSKFENGTNPPSYEEISKSTATIVHEGGIGSGFFIDKNLLVTNNHVVEGAKDDGVFFRTREGIKDDGDVVIADAKSDLAIIWTLGNNYQALEIGNSEELKMGDEIFVIGSPRGLGGTLSKGIISANRGNFIQITAPISQGSSSSPVFSKDFKVIGIAVSSIEKGQNLNFAVPVSKLKNLIQDNKVSLERVETKEVVRQSKSNFDKELASYENKEDKTPQEIFDMAVAYYWERNHKKAFYWFEKIANQGYAPAQYNLALMYHNGEGVAKDYKKEFYWCQKAADQELASAQYNLALMYHNGEGVAKDYKKAAYWYQKAANQELAFAQYNLAVMYHKGEGVAKDYKKAVYWYQKVANQGFASAQNNLALIYYKGEEVAKDYKKAVYWYQKAADQGDAFAQHSLGVTYHKGRGVTKDYKKAFYWYEKAANQGNVGAQNNLALMYNNGKGVVRDHRKALYWYEKAADQGDTKAQFNLALMYDKGEGVAKDYKKALYWYEKAANQGNVGAQSNLGSMYYKGKGVPQNYQKAIYWYEKAASQGYASAQNNVGVMYYRGEGVTKNYIEAYKWVILAKAQRNENNEKINEVLDSLEKLMTFDQIVEARELANQFETQAKFRNGVNPLSYEEVSKSTVTIIHEEGIGSGFFIEKNLLVTNHHVVEGAKDGGVFFRTQEGIKDNGDVVIADAESDLAIIRTFRNDYQALEMGGDEELKIGDEIFVIGSPKGLGGTLSKGIISAQRRGDHLQITAPISSGSSGSPVFSKDFKVIGISVSYMPEGQNLNFAISVSKLKDLIQKNKIVLKKTETEKAVRHTENDFDKLLESYENKEDKTPQEMMKLGAAYYLKKNYQKAFLWFGKAANQGNVSAQFLFALMYYNGEGVATDYLKAVYWLEKAANQEDATAQYNLGVAYHKGKGVIKDYRKAFYWYEKAANQDNANAQCNLGFMYNKGEGVAKDHLKAVYWLEKAANQGDATAQYNLGVIYYYGKGGRVKDYKKAFYWYEKAANQGNVSAQSDLGFMYHKGEGTIKNYGEAIYWLEKAAKQGDENAQFNLGVVYENGEGDGKDYQKALYWYQRSADQGNANAQLNLGVMNYYGEGIAKNYVEAYKWSILAKSPRNEHNEKINKLLNSLKKLMTPAQIAKGQKLASQFEVQGK